MNILIFQLLIAYFDIYLNHQMQNFFFYQKQQLSEISKIFHWIIFMTRHSANFQVTQLLQTTVLDTMNITRNDFGSFIYKDHVTRKLYDFNKLKGNSISEDDTIFTAKQSKNLNSFTGYNKQQTKGNKQKQQELSYFLKELKIMKKIRNQRNIITSGVQRLNNRHKSIRVNLPINKKSSISLLKHEIRSQVNSLNNQIFHEYLCNKQPFNNHLPELNKVSSQGALTTNKLKQIKIKIKQINQPQKKVQKKKYKENVKDEQVDTYFDKIWKDMQKDINRKMRNQSEWNWKYGKKQTIQQMMGYYQHDQQIKMLRATKNT